MSLPPLQGMWKPLPSHGRTMRELRPEAKVPNSTHRPAGPCQTVDLRGRAERHPAARRVDYGPADDDLPGGSEPGDRWSAHGRGDEVRLSRDLSGRLRPAPGRLLERRRRLSIDLYTDLGATPAAVWVARAGRTGPGDEPGGPRPARWRCRGSSRQSSSCGLQRPCGCSGLGPLRSMRVPTWLPRHRRLRRDLPVGRRHAVGHRAGGGPPTFDVGRRARRSSPGAVLGLVRWSRSPCAAPHAGRG